MIYAFHPDALLELEEQAAWYEARRRGLGLELLAEVRGTLECVAEQPLIGVSVPQIQAARRVLLASFPLSVVYLIDRDTLVVVAIAHARRRPGYWRGRL